MVNLDSKVKKEWSLLRTTFDVVAPIIGDIDLYHKHRDLGKSKQDAFWDAFPTYFGKYLAYGIAIYKIII